MNDKLYKFNGAGECTLKVEGENFCLGVGESNQLMQGELKIYVISPMGNEYLAFVVEAGRANLKSNIVVSKYINGVSQFVKCVYDGTDSLTVEVLPLNG